MKKILFICLLALLSGCASVHVTQNGQDENGRPVTCDARYTTVFRSLDGIKISACGAQGEAQKAESETQKLEGALNLILKSLAVAP